MTALTPRPITRAPSGAGIWAAFIAARVVEKFARFVDAAKPQTEEEIELWAIK